MKKCSVLILLLAAILLLVACTKTSGAVPEERLIRVGFSQVGSESDWRIANTASMVAALSEANGYELLFDNAKQRQENQLLAIRNYIQQDVDYIVLAPITESGWDDVLQEAKNNHIPVIIVDRRIDVADESLYTSWVGSDFLAEGRRAVRWLEAQLEARPIWELVARLPGEYTEAKSYELVRDYLKADRDIQLIYSENDNMSFGAMRALDEAGISYGLGGDVMILSFDAVREALRLCLDGRIDACAECNPLHGPRVAALIRQMEEGRTPGKLNYVLESVYTQSDLSPAFLEAREY